MRPGFRMTIGADPGEVARVNAAFAEFADAHALPASVRRSMNVVLDELLINAIVYGFPEGARGEVTVEAELLADRVRVTLTDDGRPFDPDQRTAASWSYPLGTRVRVTVTGSTNSVEVVIIDRGPGKALVRQGRIIDLSRAAFERLADPDLGVISVNVRD